MSLLYKPRIALHRFTAYAALIAAVLLIPLRGQAEETSIVDCEKAYSTQALNECAKIELDNAKAELAHYFSAVVNHLSDDSATVAAINLAQADWESYRSAHCSAVYSMWRQGTIRGLMHLSCMTALTQRRTHELWDEFLTDIEGNSDILPEPGI